MRHESYASLDDLLAAETISRHAGAAITAVTRTPARHRSAFSGSRFVAVETNDGQGPRFFVKQTTAEDHWMARATGDEGGREVAIWERGLLDRLPPEIDGAVLACARMGNDWAILMRDVSETLIPAAEPDGEPLYGETLDLADHLRYLDALAALHATFWEAPEIRLPGLCTPWRLYTAFGPATARREADAHPFVRTVHEGWERFPTLFESALADLVYRLADDPTPLC